ncbi:Sec-independent protein translocase subunit TatA [Kitasatospora sp. NBC_00240]|uniref:Sec-independent protein translocase subunit TatA n=1 Tax=Kitasatospora sp. NBC_00240 TaxID=2903567 RepID=UPI002255BECF|nr:Sec-independent protein translocase subunit TatA [Kitasatospora sp. NBC_00240]MCX5215139.1 Sec-independent protein translocase subunit TatA [Kitasatospora sp. NBC_00240]
MLRNGLEPWHILVVVAVVILLFGSKKLPDMARGLGRSMRILKAETAALREDESTTEGGAPAETPRPAVAASGRTSPEDRPTEQQYTPSQTTPSQPRPSGTA